MSRIRKWYVNVLGLRNDDLEPRVTKKNRENLILRTGFRAEVRIQDLLALLSGLTPQHFRPCTPTCLETSRWIFKLTEASLLGQHEPYFLPYSGN